MYEKKKLIYKIKRRKKNRDDNLNKNIFIKEINRKKKQFNKTENDLRFTCK